MECINCDRYYDDIEDECPYCGVSKYAVRCENCGDIIDIDSECCCGRSLDDLEEETDDLAYYDPYVDDEDDDEIDYGDNICENCTYWQAHSRGFRYGMICQKTGQNTDPNDSCGYFSKMFHFSNYGEEGQYSFVDTEQEKQRKLYYWRNRKF
jgi:hypothetical protein